ncbi:MAG: NnrS family protein [Paracoccaceae bacterium]|nr:NnrS family protein [Paracoccaceae bacterium]
MSVGKTVRVLFSQGLRVFFLAAGIYALVAMGIWVTWLASLAATGEPPDVPFEPAPALWHAHEMIFGYAGAVIGGFFLTAVPSWTGAPAARSWFLTLLAAAWLGGRLAVWWSGALDPIPVAVLDLSFLPLLAAKIAVQLARRPKPQNLLFLVLISIVWIGNLMVHLDWTGLWPGRAATGLQVGLLGVASMIMVISGRVTPAFTLNAMRQAGRETGLPRQRTSADRPAMAAAILIPVSIGLGLPDLFVAAMALIAGIGQLIRLAGWRGFWTLHAPILWSLHLAGAMLGLGYLAFAVSLAGWITETGALHLIGIGAIGGMSLAMMSRAALGHTDRDIVAPRAVAWAYALVAIAAVIRAAGGEAGPGWYDWAMLISGALWLTAFALFLTVYLPVLTSPATSRTP